MGMIKTRRCSWIGVATTHCIAVNGLAAGIGIMAMLAGGCTAEQKIACGTGTELVAGKCVPLTLDASRPLAEAGPSRFDSGAPLVCGEDTFEADGGCVGRRPIGAACDNGMECSSGTCLTESRGAVDGYCTVVACNASRPCPAGSRCYFSSTEQSFLCLTYCDDDADCRDEYACQPLYTTDASVCTPSCVTTGACPSGTRCDADSGKCLLHECELGARNACASDDDAGVDTSADLICYADRLGLSASGAVCLPACDPQAAESTCAGNEVCQPLPEAPATLGLCVPPLCMNTEDCSAGAQCMDGVCQPPARCDAKGACADDDTVCVGGARGQCMPACPTSPEKSTCRDIHTGLSCAQSLGACLPTGSFPGSVCTADGSSPCSDLSVRDKNGDLTITQMVCEGGLCLASCATGGDALCGDILETLTCAQDVFDTPLCLPAGSFPGGPCDADAACDLLAQGDLSIPMTCARNQCLITCDDATTGDVLCDSIDASLVCTADAFGGTTDVCLPRGSYPGGPCAAGDACDAGMTCEDSMCLYQCTTGGESLCNAVSPTLSCASGVFSEPVCLPRGSFPGSPCRTGIGNECDQNLRGLPDANLACVNNLCVVQCEALTVFASGDALCATINSALTCVGSPSVDFCTTACVGAGNACPAGNSCLVSEDACLPDGSFLGSACAGGTTCNSAGTPPLACAPGASPKCAAACATRGMSSGDCQALNASFGTTFDTCTDVDPGAATVLACIDAIP